MPLAEEIITGRHSIQAYDSHQVTINQRPYSASLLLSASDLVHPWPVDSADNLTTEHLQAIIDLSPEVVLLGSGPVQRFPSIEVIGFFAGHNIGLEVMDNGALCRTFNILVAEDRKVVAGIILPATSG
jgi:uncharacterized protein